MRLGWRVGAEKGRVWEVRVWVEPRYGDSGRLMSATLRGG